jgi:hypothetical protein
LPDLGVFKPEKRCFRDIDPPIERAGEIYRRLLDGLPEPLRHDIATALLVAAVLQQQAIRCLISENLLYEACSLSAGAHQLNLWRTDIGPTRASLHAPDAASIDDVKDQADIERLSQTPIQALAADALPLSESPRENRIRAAVLLTAAWRAIENSKTHNEADW